MTRILCSSFHQRDCIYFCLTVRRFLVLYVTKIVSCSDTCGQLGNNKSRRNRLYALKCLLFIIFPIGVGKKGFLRERGLTVKNANTSSQRRQNRDH